MNYLKQQDVISLICFYLYWVLLSGFFSCLFIHFSSLDVRDIFESIITGTIIALVLSVVYVVIVNEVYEQGKKYGCKYDFVLFILKRYIKKLENKKNEIIGEYGDLLCNNQKENFQNYFMIKTEDVELEKQCYGAVVLYMKLGDYHDYDELKSIDENAYLLSKVYQNNDELKEKIKSWVQKVKKTHLNGFLYVIEQEEINELILTVEKLNQNLNKEIEVINIYHNYKTDYETKNKKYENEKNIHQTILSNFVLKEEQVILLPTFDVKMLSFSESDLYKMNIDDMVKITENSINEIQQAYQEVQEINQKLSEIIKQNQNVN